LFEDKIRTLATDLLAELGFFGDIVKTLTQTPFLNELPFKNGAFFDFTFFGRDLLLERLLTDAINHV
jgi:hypothetical protein